MLLLGVGILRDFKCGELITGVMYDRYLTDIVFGNRHGMLTIRPAPLTTQGEPAGVVLVSGPFRGNPQGWCW